MRSGEYLKKEKRGTRFLHFEKVRILFVPREVTITYEPTCKPLMPDEAGPLGEWVPMFALRYGLKPEHLVRKYPSLELAKASGQKLADKFGVKLVIRVQECGCQVPHTDWPPEVK